MESELFSAAIALVERRTPDFGKLHLQYSGYQLVPESKLLPPSLKFPLTNLASGRQLSLSFIRYVQPRAHYGASIARAGSGSFLLENWLLIHPEVREHPISTVDGENPALLQGFDRFLDDVLTLVEKHLQPCLDGSYWENVPFDWGPYK